MSIDGSMHSLFGVSKAAADLLVQEYGRYFDMPTVCFRGGCLTGPQHAGAQLHGFLSYLMKLHGHRRRRTRSSATTASRCATTSTPHDVVRAFEAFHADPRAGRRLQPRRRARVQLLDARGDRAVRARSPGASSTGRSPTRRGSATTAGGSPTSAAFEARLPGLGAALRHRGRSCARSTTPTSSAGATARVKLSVVIPAHNEAEVDRADGRGADRARSGPRAIDYEIVVVDDALDRRHRRRACARSPRATRASAACARRHRNGFGFAVRAGLERVHGRRGGDHDGRRLRRPARPRPLLPPARGRLRLRVRLALHAAARRSTTTRGSSCSINRVVNLGIRAALPPRLQRHDERVQGLPARGHRERPAAALAALQPDRRAAAEGGRARALLRDRADHVDATATAGESKLALQEMGSRYLFIVLYVFLEHHLSRGDYRRPQGTMAPRPAVKPPQGAMHGQVSRRLHRRLERH